MLYLSVNTLAIRSAASSAARASTIFFSCMLVWKIPISPYIFPSALLKPGIIGVFTSELEVLSTVSYCRVRIACFNAFIVPGARDHVLPLTGREGLREMVAQVIDREHPGEVNVT